MTLPVMNKMWSGPAHIISFSNKGAVEARLLGINVSSTPWP
jgi:hypothetical protein